ncbi:MAG: hypothetical protein PVS3B1_15390 [Ktedonobacteraceae bacterium]
MWTSTIDLDFKKVLLTQLIGRFYRNIYFSSYSPLQVQNLPRQSLPSPSWVRVRNRLAGISANDLHLLYGDSDIRVAPSAMPGHKQFYPGREVVGEVIEIGDDVQHLHVGDRVVLQNGPNCLSAGLQPICRFCLAGSYNLCENSTMSTQPLGGGWSEEMLLHEQQLFQVPATLNDEQAVMLEPTAVALHAVLHRLPRHGERILIIGAGSIGLLILQIVHALAPQTEVSVLARHPFQVERATRLGAAHIIYPRDAYIGVKRATQARLYQGPMGNQTLSGGYDVVYDTVGQRKTLQNALRWTRAQGTIVLVGHNLHMMHVDLTPLWYQEINLLGSTSHGVEYWPIDGGEQRSTFSVATELIEQNRIAPEQLITHHFALNNYKSALVTVADKAESRAVKVVFDYSLLPASVVPNVRASAPRRRPVTVNFDIDYPNEAPEQTEHAPDQQKVQQPSARNYASTPYTPFPYAATIQETPPIKSFPKEVPQSSASHSTSNKALDDYTDSDDTATAIPVVSKHMRVLASPASPEPVEVNQYKSTPTLVKPEHDDSYQAFPLEIATPLPPDPDNLLPVAVVAVPESATPEQSEQLIASQQPAHRDNEIHELRESQEEHVATLQEAWEPQEEPGAQSPESPEVQSPEPEVVEMLQHEEGAEPDLAQSSQQQTNQEQTNSEEGATEAVAEIAAELDPQTLEPDDESAPTQTQRSRSSNRKRKYNSRF